MLSFEPELGLNYGSGYYAIIRNIISEFLDNDGHLTEKSSVRMQRKIDSGAYNNLLSAYFRNNPPMPIKK